MNGTDLDARLQTSLGAPVTAAQHVMLDKRFATRLTGAPTPSRAAGRRWSVVAILVVAILSVSAVVGVSAEMRLTEDPLGLESAGQYAQEIAAAEQIVPIPAGAAWPAYLGVQDPNGSYARGGGRSQVEFVGVCLWSESWLSADRAGDSVTRVIATAGLKAVRTWPIYITSDPAHGMRALIDQLITSAVQGSAAPIHTFVAINCAP